METFWCVGGRMGGCGLPGAFGRVALVVDEWEMGGFGSAGARMPIFSRYGAGRGGWCWKQKQDTEGPAVWKREGPVLLGSWTGCVSAGKGCWDR